MESNKIDLKVVEPAQDEPPTITSTDKENYDLNTNVRIEGEHFGSSQNGGKIVFPNNMEGTDVKQ